MPTFLIERDIPGIGEADEESLRETIARSKGVIEAMNAEGKPIAWIRSHLTRDRFVCVYTADRRSFVVEHAERTGVPATAVTPVVTTFEVASGG